MPTTRRHSKMQTIVEISKQLGAEKNIDKLLQSIVDAVQNIVDADRCSLFLVDFDRNELWTKIAQGLGETTIRLPIGYGIAGACAASKETIRIDDAYQDKRFAGTVDRATGYHTKSILTVPMLDVDGLCIGVIQAINKKKIDENGQSCIVSFDEEDQEDLLALGGPAAVAIENAMLQQDIEKLFEGFIRASVYAIEARDPTTSGHSERVAVLTVGLADALQRHPPAEHRGVLFSDDDMRELRYAALLHDFGKVGVRERVLVKANKLYPHEMERIEQRFWMAKQQALVACLHKKVDLLKPAGMTDVVCAHCQQADIEYQQQIDALESFWQFITQCNKPTVLEKSGFEKLHDIAQHRWLHPDPQKEMQLLLEPDELRNLSIARGSLNDEERREIESHVEHTYQFLLQIPWTRNLERVPLFASMHHEKLNGEGYPLQASADDIPVQSRMMSIADIYDALTASDRPYKAALPHEKALDILHAEAKRGAIDTSLVRVFIESQTHLLLNKSPKK